MPFDIDVPRDAEPGDHSGGIVTSLTLAEPDGTGDRMSVERRIGSRISIRVRGAVRPRAHVHPAVSHVLHDEWNPFASGSVRVRYSVKNTGNVRLHAQQVVSVDGSAWSTRQRRRGADTTELLPGASSAYTQTITGVRPAFRTTVEVRLVPYGTDGDRVASAHGGGGPDPR